MPIRSRRFDGRSLKNEWQNSLATGVVIRAGLWETWGMSEKRTKSDRSQRQADKLEKKARHPGAKKKKRPSRKSIPETNQSKVARIENSPSQRRRERNEREDSAR